MAKVGRRGYGFAIVFRSLDSMSTLVQHRIYQQTVHGCTAAAILLLQKDGRLKTGDRVMQLLSEDKLPQAWTAIAVRELLSHTSGLKDYSSAAQDRQRDYFPTWCLPSSKMPRIHF
jgi:hypothetical protein